MSRLINKFFVCIFFAASAKAAYSDIYIEERITTTVGGSETQGIKKIYISKNKTLLQDPALKVRIIFDYDNNKVYTINDPGKDISVYPIEKYIMPAPDFYSDLVKLKDSDLHIRESGNKKQLGKYNCFEIVIFIPRIAAMINLWLGSIDPSFSQHLAFLEKHGDIISKKLLPVLSSNNACIIESKIIIVRPKEPEKYLKSELLNISIQDIPDSIFSLPENYRIVNFN
jgi:hypothetical protein